MSSSSVATLSNLVSATNVAGSSVSASQSSMMASVSSKVSSISSSVSSVGSMNSSSASKSKNGAAGMIANPISWKIGAALGALMAGSFVLGAGL